MRLIGVGLQEENIRKFEEAKKLAHEIKNDFPNAPDGYALLGLAEVLLDGNQKGEAWIEDALEKNPNHDIALVAKGILEVNDGNIQQGQSILDKLQNMGSEHAGFLEIYIEEIGPPVPHENHPFYKIFTIIGIVIPGIIVGMYLFGLFENPGDLTGLVLMTGFGLTGIYSLWITNFYQKWETLEIYWKLLSWIAIIWGVFLSVITCFPILVFVLMFYFGSRDSG